MNIYFSIDPEVTVPSALEPAKRLLDFLLDQGHTVYRAQYALADDPDLWLMKNFHLKSKPTFAKQRKIHMDWIDKAGLLIADISDKSEGMAMIIQRALDKPFMGLKFTPIILIKNKKKRKFGKIIRGLIESGKVVYFEYESIEEVIKNWTRLLKEAMKIKDIS